MKAMISLKKCEFQSIDELESFSVIINLQS